MFYLRSLWCLFLGCRDWTLPRTAGYRIHKQHIPRGIHREWCVNDRTFWLTARIEAGSLWSSSFVARPSFSNFDLPDLWTRYVQENITISIRIMWRHPQRCENAWMSRNARKPRMRRSYLAFSYDGMLVNVFTSCCDKGLGDSLWTLPWRSLNDGHASYFADFFLVVFFCPNRFFVLVNLSVDINKDILLIASVHFFFVALTRKVDF